MRKKKPKWKSLAFSAVSLLRIRVPICLTALRQTVFFRLPCDSTASGKQHMIRRSSCDKALDVQFAIWLIGLYQRYVSPRKGFCCAHRVLHGQDSCSEAVRKIVEAQGVCRGYLRIWQRFHECRIAALVLRANSQDADAQDQSEIDETQGRPVGSQDVDWGYFCCYGGQGGCCFWPLGM